MRAKEEGRLNGERSCTLIPLVTSLVVWSSGRHSENPPVKTGLQGSARHVHGFAGASFSTKATRVQQKKRIGVSGGRKYLANNRPFSGVKTGVRSGAERGAARGGGAEHAPHRSSRRRR